MWEEYRYDPLGLRILVRTRADRGMCLALLPPRQNWRGHFALGAGGPLNPRWFVEQFVEA